MVAYDRDILEEYSDMRQRPVYPSVEVGVGMVVEDRISGFCGDVVRWNARGVTLRDRGQHLREFGWKPGGFLLDGQPVSLERPVVAPTAGQRITASGSVAGDGTTRVARPNRIWVEGTHDAELLEQVWGDDLRDIGIVVEALHGADHLGSLLKVDAAINEAIEIAKRYGSDESGGFVNGVLDHVARELRNEEF